MVKINRNFIGQVERNLGCAVLLAGSGSDKSHIDRILAELKNYDVPCDVRIASAHKQPDVLAALVAGYDNLNGALAYIAVAGGTDALSGTVSFRSRRPVISCPPDAPNQSCLTNPPGSSNAYIANPKNAARFVLQMFSHLNPNYRKCLEREVEEKRSKLAEEDLHLQLIHHGEM